MRGKLTQPESRNWGGGGGVWGGTGDRRRRDQGKGAGSASGAKSCDRALVPAGSLRVLVTTQTSPALPPLSKQADAEHHGLSKFNPHVHPFGFSLLETRGSGTPG